MNEIANPNLLWIIPAAIGLGFLVRSFVEGRGTRPMSRKQTRALADLAHTAYDKPTNLVRGTAIQTQRDGLRPRVRKWFARAARLIERLPAREEKVNRHKADQARAEERREKHERRSEANEERSPHLSFVSVTVLNALLAAGDVFIISTAIQQSDSGIRATDAYLTSLALAAALFVGGKVAGYALRRLYGHRLVVPLVGAGIAVFSIGLYLLRRDITEAWLVLAMAPALGAAGVAVLGPSREQKGARRTARTATKAGRRAERALAKSGRLRGRIESLLARAKTELVSNGLLARSLEEMAGLDPALAEFELIANEIGVTLGTEFTHGQRQSVDANASSAPPGDEIDLPAIEGPEFEPLRDAVHATSDEGNGSRIASTSETETQS